MQDTVYVKNVWHEFAAMFSQCHLDQPKTLSRLGLIIMLCEQGVLERSDLK
jgi:hypothetical protein